MKTGIEQENLQVLMSLLTEARAEADRLQAKADRYENLLISTKLLMGHELKKPATALTGYLDLALEALRKSQTEYDTEIAECLVRARTECGLLDELNQVFLALLRVNGDRDTLPVQKIDVEELFREITTGFPETYDARRRVRLSVEPGMQEVNFNRSALKIILSNLVENSLLYSDQKEQIEVTMTAGDDGRHDGGEGVLRITVTDIGTGIPEESVQRIFDPFVRLHADRAQGSGLGLTLVRSLVELYGGDISVVSGNGRGTTMSLSMPMIAEQTEHMVL